MEIKVCPWEDIYQVDGSGNFDWQFKEGTHCFNRTTPLAPPLECSLLDSVSTINGVLKDPIVDT